MAAFVIHLRMTPAEYYALTVEQRDAITTEWSKAQKQKR